MSASQNLYLHDRTAANNVALPLALGLLLAACSVGVAVAQTKTCECEFSTKDYAAYGTNGACGIFMYNRARTCEVSFAGTGANAKLLRAMLGDGALESQFSIAPQIFAQYIAYAKGGDKGRFLDTSFIESSMVVLARAALFRESSTRADLPLKNIDTMFVQFSKKYSERIAATFRGTDRPFTVEWEKGVIFSVGQGYVELNFQQIAKVRVLYFSEQPR